MNRIYRIVWNRVLNAPVVASELAGSSSSGVVIGKRGSHARPALLAAACLAVIAAMQADPAQASDQRLSDLEALAARYAPQAQDAAVAAPARVSVTAGNALNAGLGGLLGNVVGGVEQVLTQTLDVTRLDDVLTDVGGGVSDTVNGVGQGLGYVVGGLTGSEALAGTVTGVTDELSGGLPVIVANVVDTNVNDLLGSTTATVDGVLEQAVIGLTTTLSGPESSLGNVGGALVGLTGSLTDVVDTTVTTVLTGAPPASGVDPVGETAKAIEELLAVATGGLQAGQPGGDADAQRSGLLGGVLAGVEDLVTDVLDQTQLDTVLTQVGDGLSGTVVQVGGALGEVVTGLTGSEALGGAVSGTTDALGAGLPGIVSNVTDTDVHELVESTTGTLDNAVGELAGGLGTALTGDATSLSGLTDLVDGVTDVVDDTTGALLATAEGGNGGAGGNGGSLGQQLTGGLGELVGGVESGLTNVLDETRLDDVLTGVVGGVADVVAGTGDALGEVVGGLTGSDALGDTVNGVTDALADGLGDIVANVDDTSLTGIVDAVGNTVDGVVNQGVGGLTGTLDGLTGSTGGLGGIGDTVTNLVDNVTDGLGNVVADLTGQPTNTASGAPAGLTRSAKGTIVGNGGIVGSVETLVDPLLSSVLGGDGWLTNGSLAVNSANIQKAYSTVSVLGIPVVNLSPVGQAIDALGGAATGGNSHLTLIGGVVSDSYLTNVNDGSAGGLLGLLLPDGSPAHATQCLNVLGLVTADCWAVNAAQDYQTLIGEGATANGSKEVVIGSNASHTLPSVDARDLFTDGFVDADYDARLGHSVVVGDSASGTANGQTILGAQATSNQANSVALGFKSNADRGAQAGYTAYGLTAAQTSSGEVSIGSAGAERQITHVAAGSQDTDAVNVAQLKGAVSQIDSLSAGAVKYDTDAAGNPDYARVTLEGASGTTLGNLAAGVADDEAVNVGQLAPVVDALGGGATLDASTGAVTGPTYVLDDGSDTGTTASFGDVGSALENLDGRTVSNTTNINNVINGTAGLVRQDPATLAVTVAGQTGGTQVDFGNVDGEARRLSGVANAQADDEAVNLAQLKAIGGEVDTLGAAAVKYDTDAAGNPDYARVTLEGASGTTLGNLAAGVADDEAVNVGQLAPVVDALGGGATIDASTGAVTGPTYVLDDGSDTGTTANFGDVGSALENLDGRTSSNTTNINNVINGTVGLVRQDPTTLVVTVAGQTGGTQVDFGNVDGEARRLSGVAAGVADDEAVNVGQLAPVVDALGGGATIDASTGAVTGPTYVLDDGSDTGTTANFGDVGSALENLDGRTISNTTHINNVINGTVGLVRQDPTTLVVTVAGQTGGTQVDFGNVDGEARRLSGVADAEADDEAVNLAQLSAVADDVASLGARSVQYDVDGSGNVLNQVTLSGDGSGAAVGISNLAAGAVAAGSTDAVNGAQLHATNSAVADYLGGGTRYDSTTNTWTGPSYTITNVAADGSTSSGSYNSVGDAFGAVDSSLVNINTQISELQTATADSKYLSVESDKAGAEATGSDSLAVGPEASASGAGSVAVGNAASSSADGSVAIGDGASASEANSVALGAGSTTDVGAQSGYDGAYVEAGSSNSAGEVSVGSDGAERKVTHVADGSDRYDAVNVGQLQGGVDYAIGEANAYTDTQIQNINNGGSGMFRVNDTDGLGQPVASGDNATAGGAGAVASGSGSTALGSGATATADNSVALGAGSVADRGSSVSVGSSGAERQITNVAAGTGNTDAVNVGQFNQGLANLQDWSKNYTDDRFNQIGGEIRRVDNRAMAGVASAMAVAGLPQAYLPGRSMAAAALSGYNGEGGIAIGISGVSEGGRWIYKLSGTTNTRGDGGVSVGAGIQW